MIRKNVNLGDLLKSILHEGDFIRQFNVETHGQYWGVKIYGLGCNAKFLLH